MSEENAQTAVEGHAQEESAQVADTTTAAAPATASEKIAPSSNAEVHNNLTKFFENQSEIRDQAQTTQADDSASEETDSSEEQSADNAVAAAEEGEKNEGTEESADGDDNTAADFSGIETPSEETEPVYADSVDALKAKYPRQNAKLYEEAAGYAVEAKKGHELVKNLGGDAYLEPLQKISTGLQSGSSSEIFSGVVEAGSTDALTNLIGDALNLALVKSKDFQTNEEIEGVAEFGKGLQAIADKVIESRFGNGTTIEKLETLAALDQTGWLAALEKWKADEAIDMDEFWDLIEAEKDPVKFKSLNEKVKSLEGKINAEKADAEQKSRTEAQKAQENFDNYGDEQITKVLQDVLWKTSVLRDISTDSEEIKAEKTLMREVLKTDALKAFRAETQGKEENSLFDKFKKGKDTANFKTALKAAVNSAILNTKDRTAVAERLISKSYGQTRNGSIAKAPAAKVANDAQNVQQNPPTPIQPVSAQPKSVADIRKNLENMFRANGR